ncbi:MAG: hypothetical protein R2824_01365 [Saprospiraceae bacterium]|nr:hypothetical protein [Lewinella sp.]
MKLTLTVFFLLLISLSCHGPIVDSCEKSLYEKQEIDDLKIYLQRQLEEDFVPDISDYRLPEIYRLTVTNGWFSNVYLSLFQQNDHYYIESYGYSKITKSYQRRLLELEPYQWKQFFLEFNTIEFWCRPTYYKEEIINGGPDGTWYFLEGQKGGNYQLIQWAYAIDKERLISLIVRFAKIETFEPYINALQQGDSIIFALSLNNLINTQEFIIVTPRGDSLSSKKDIPNFKLHKRDSSEIYQYRLIQKTSDGLTNEIPFGSPRLIFSRNRR